MRKHIPNTITCLNLFSGCLACLAAMEGNFLLAFLLVMLAAVFDFFDGMAARVLKAYSAIGKELDSLADMVSFGVAPGFAVFFALQPIAESLPLATYIPYPYIAFLIPVFSALRLAKFNVDERQTTSFIGMPTPANAMFWMSAIAGTYHYAEANTTLYGFSVLILTVVTSLLLVSELPMFSLKIKNLSWKDNKVRYVLIGCAILSIVLLHWTGIALTIVLYILFSLILHLKARGK